jgi:hypothetical protein
VQQEVLDLKLRAAPRIRSSSPVPSVVAKPDLGLPRVNRAEPCTGKMPVSTHITDFVGLATVDRMPVFNIAAKLQLPFFIAERGLHRQAALRSTLL